ncbi:ABC transporter ATP-binding protein [Pseudomonadota bacterium]
MEKRILIDVKNACLSAEVVTKRNIPREYMNFFKLSGALKKRKRITILDNVSLLVRKGDRIALTGRNGAGKSSLLRLLAGIYVPERGTVQINGEVGGLFSSNVALNQNATGFENIYLRCYLLGIPESEIQEKIEDVQEFSELTASVLQRPIKDYSTGMKLRLNTAMTFLKKPSILMMDEWIGAGDKAFRKKITNKMDAIVDEVEALVVATHQQKIIDDLGCHEILLDEGRIVKDENSC